MISPVPKLVVIGLQQTFLTMVLDQINGLFKNRITARALALNEVGANPPKPAETLLYFNQGLKDMVEKVTPRECRFIYAHRENLIFNMKALLTLTGFHRFLVVNDVKRNTDLMTQDLENMDLGHEFIPYYPDTPFPENIDYVVTAGERMLVPSSLESTPIIDIGLRFMSLATIYELFEYFAIPYNHADLARHYMRTMMLLSLKWPILGNSPIEVSMGDEQGFSGLTQVITRHGFLDESSAILTIYKKGKKENKALGRAVVLDQLREKGYAQTLQQLRLKLERMDSLGLLIVRPGRGGTTLSEKGEAFLGYLIFSGHG